MKKLILSVAFVIVMLIISSCDSGKEKTTDYNDNEGAVILDEITPAIITAETPYDVGECVGKNYSVVENEFYKVGFNNIKIQKIEDLKLSDVDKVNTIESISINGKTDFVKGEEFDENDEVLVVYHAFKKCNVKVHINFISNFIFSRYHVNFLLNGLNMGTMEHGIDNDFEFTVEPGEYIISFQNYENPSVHGEVVLLVDCDMETSYEISCHSDEVSVEELYIDRLVELSENEVKLNMAASDYKYKNYTEVETSLRELGFTNIKYNVLYDIIWGITENGEVDEVSIAGNKDFNRGDIFASDVEIIITYHMPEEDNPSNIRMEKDSSAYYGMNYLEVADLFNDYGFTNLEFDSIATDDAYCTDGEVYSVKIDGWSFDAGDVFKPTDKVCVDYYICNEIESTLTVENCSEFAEMLANNAEIDDSYSDFATKYKDRIVEFDGRIDYCANHGNYKTRFDYLLSAGDYDPEHQIGPTFKFEDVNYFDLNTDLEVVSVGLNVRIVAKVVSFDSNCGLFYLDPVSITRR